MNLHQLTILANAVVIEQDTNDKTFSATISKTQGVTALKLEAGEGLLKSEMLITRFTDEQLATRALSSFKKYACGEINYELFSIHVGQFDLAKEASQTAEAVGA